MYGTGLRSGKKIVMLEKRGETPRNSKSDVLKAGLVALSVLGAHDSAKSAEIPPNATWDQGVRELRRSVLQEPVEYVATGAVLHTKTIVWPRTIRGEQRGLNAPVGPVLQELRILADGNVVTNYCDIHTHPAMSIAKELGIHSGDRAYAPPSSIDALVGSGR